MLRRAYEGPADLDLLQRFNAAAFAATDGCGYLHPGDIAHRLFNGNRFFQPSDVLVVWEDSAGVAGWVLIAPRHAGFDAQVRPNLRGGTFERSILAEARDTTIEVMRQREIAGERLVTDAFRCDTVRSDLLVELGWEPAGGEPWVLNRVSLSEAEEPAVATGYRIRTVRGPEEAGLVAAVHSASFGSVWTEDLYRGVMTAPGYDPGREFVVEAPDGTLAAFTVTWHDEENRVGLFEPVGTHPAHRRRGLGRAMLLFAMRRMAAAGMTHALVVNEGDNDGSRALYRSCGFEPWHLIDDYTIGV